MSGDSDARLTKQVLRLQLTKIAAACWRQCIAGANANCLLDKGPKRFVSRDAAVPKNLREIARGSNRVADDQQPVYSDINHRARCLVCGQHPMKTIIANLNELFESRKRTDNKVPSTTKNARKKTFWRITLSPTRRSTRLWNWLWKVASKTRGIVARGDMLTTRKSLL